MKPSITMKRISTIRMGVGVILTGALLLSCTGVLAAAAPVIAPLGWLQPDLQAPAGLARDAAGRIYITDPPAGEVSVVDAFGRFITTRQGFARPVAVAVDAQGNIYVSEAQRGRVIVLNAQWGTVGQLGQGDGEFGMAAAIAIHPTATPPLVCVSDGPTHQVKVYQNGVRIRTFGSYGGGDGQFSFPSGICFNGRGDLLVVDQGNDRIEIFSGEGVFQRGFTLMPPGFRGRSGRGQGVSVDNLGRIYVADAFQDIVKVFDDQGVLLAGFSGYGMGLGQLRSPAGLVLDGQGRVFVASASNGRVEMFGVDCYLGASAVPAVQTAAVGSTVSFSLSNACAGAATFQWRKGTNDLSDGGVVSGATNATLTLSGIGLEDAGTYSAVVAGANGTMVSGEAELVVVAAPVITRSPLSQTVNQGNTAAFDVQVQGLGLAYQWFYKGIALQGATASTFTLANVQPSDAGTYSVIVSNVAGAATSTAATLTVVSRPAFVFQPQSQTVAEKGVATLSGVASGTPAIAYQWYFQSTPLAGKTATSLVLSNVTPVSAGAYYLIAANAAGRATSQVATLSIIPDTTPPRLLGAAGGRATNRNILLSFSKPVSTATAQRLLNYQLMGPDSVIILSAVVTNGTNVNLLLNKARTTNANYSLRVRDVTDTAYTPNLVTPNPTLLSVATTVDLIGNNSFRWKYLQVTNAQMDGGAWKQPAFGDGSWSNGFGIFYGNRTNSPYQPNPNPNVRLPYSLSTSDTTNYQVYTVLNVFTNAGNVVQENTYYFRGTFVFPAETNGALLYLRTIIDDGAVFYMNNQESSRIRMAAAPTVITYATLATSAGNQTWSPALTLRGNALGLNGLRTGTNVLAAEVHQNSTTSDDITFGAQLEADILRFAVSPRLKAGRLTDGSLVFSWDDPFYDLDAAPDLSGPWTTRSTESPATVPEAEVDGLPAQYFRLHRKP